MTRIVLTEEQKGQLRAGDDVVVCDADGTVWGGFQPIPISKDEIAELKRRSASPGVYYTSAQVRSHLDALAAEEGKLGRRLTLDEGMAVIRELRAKDPGHYRGPKG